LASGFARKLHGDLEETFAVLIRGGLETDLAAIERQQRLAIA
jgi:hypothetical protein